MSKVVDGLYHRRRGRQLLDGVLDPAGGSMPSRAGGGTAVEAELDKPARRGLKRDPSG